MEEISPYKGRGKRRGPIEAIGPYTRNSGFLCE